MISDVLVLLFSAGWFVYTIGKIGKLEARVTGLEALQVAGNKSGAAKK